MDVFVNPTTYDLIMWLLGSIMLVGIGSSIRGLGWLSLLGAAMFVGWLVKIKDLWGTQILVGTGIAALIGLVGAVLTFFDRRRRRVAEAEREPRAIDMKVAAQNSRIADGARSRMTRRKRP